MRVEPHQTKLFRTVPVNADNVKKGDGALWDGGAEKQKVLRRLQRRK